MERSFKKNTKLVLENGSVFKGFSFGAKGKAIGEVVFNTGMTGYQEVMTDPSYFGQLLTFTYPEIGNTGINHEDSESLNNKVKAIIVRNFSNNVSNWRSKLSLNEWMLNNNIIGLYGVDTRALVKILRNNGSMNGIITTDNLDFNECIELLEKFPKMSGLNLTKEVTTQESYIWNKKSKTDFDIRDRIKIKKLKVVAIDFGIKKSILNRLVSHGCEVIVMPANSSIKEVLAENPNGIFFSNGPGDPSAVSEAIELAKELIDIGTLPMFGICLGHQIFGLALGGSTYKLQFGHRGLNHPCGNNNKIEITSQNHGFAIDKESIPQDKVQITHLNLNDKTLAGLKVIDKPIFSVQYHPEAAPGPHDSDYLFRNFVSLMLERC
ncbi:MAG: carbamoyl phosphate synthase small subunit [Prochlorococcus sp. SP3034]|nr:carbamoyl phosphate synthase small subunit [Prochlorococcus sp. SP3034]|tara:strand:- start:8608 stop:9744 length:1137 start_codon:yes stop_codon:yes gene_type:complete